VFRFRRRSFVGFVIATVSDVSGRVIRRRSWCWFVWRSTARVREFVVRKHDPRCDANFTVRAQYYMCTWTINQYVTDWIETGVEEVPTALSSIVQFVLSLVFLHNDIAELTKRTDGNRFDSRIIEERLSRGDWVSM